MRLAPEKDPHLWLETAAVIAAVRPDTRFVLADFGNLAKQAEQEIETLGLTDRFILPGSVKDVGSIYAALDVLLLTSRFEGTPNVLVEAQAAGVPVVAPDIGGISEALLDGGYRNSGPQSAGVVPSEGRAGNFGRPRLGRTLHH